METILTYTSEGPTVVFSSDDWNELNATISWGSDDDDLRDMVRGTEGGNPYLVSQDELFEAAEIFGWCAAVADTVQIKEACSKTFETLCAGINEERQKGLREAAERYENQESD